MQNVINRVYCRVELTFWITFGGETEIWSSKDGLFLLCFQPQMSVVIDKTQNKYKVSVTSLIQKSRVLSGNPFPGIPQIYARNRNQIVITWLWLSFTRRKVPLRVVSMSVDRLWRMKWGCKTHFPTSFSQGLIFQSIQKRDGPLVVLW